MCDAPIQNDVGTIEALGFVVLILLFRSKIEFESWVDENVIVPRAREFSGPPSNNPGGARPSYPAQRRFFHIRSLCGLYWRPRHRLCGGTSLRFVALADWSTLRRTLQPLPPATTSPEPRSAKLADRGFFPFPPFLASSRAAA
jgi:hypothetical protein